MKKILIIIIILIIATGCLNRDKRQYKYTVELCKYKPNRCKCNLYVEVYRIFGMGALGSDLNSQYLTDSVNFRVFLGTYDDENQMIITRCNNDSIKVIKTLKTSTIPEWDHPKIIESKIFNIKKLIKDHNFE